MKKSRRRQCAFSLLELIVSIAIVAVLVAILLPALRLARDAAQTAVCAGNLKQMGIAWRMYLDDYRQFPKHTESPDWNFGGVEFRVGSGLPYLAEDRPLNAYFADATENASERLATQFRCPSDWGVSMDVGTGGLRGVSVLGEQETCFEYFGTSYRANTFLLDSSLTGIDPSGRLRRTSGRGPISPRSAIRPSPKRGPFRTKSSRPTTGRPKRCSACAGRRIPSTPTRIRR